MNVLVDTSVWSMALRRLQADVSPREQRVRMALADLVQGQRVLMLGIVRQEILSGIHQVKRFEQVRVALEPYADEAVLPVDHILAAEAYNRCRKHGVQGSSVDMLICAVAIRLGVPIFTLDRDFEHYAKLLPLGLFDGTRLP